MVKKLFLVSLLIVFNVLQSQRSSACKCSLLSKYEDSIQASYLTSEKLIEDSKLKSTALKKRFDFIEVQTLKKSASREDIVDSLELQYKQAILNKVPDSTFGFYNKRDSISKLALKKKIL